MAVTALDRRKRYAGHRQRSESRLFPKSEFRASREFRWCENPFSHPSSQESFPARFLARLSCVAMP
jgi:hypothetical protein